MGKGGLPMACIMSPVFWLVGTPRRCAGLRLICCESAGVSI